MNRRALIASCLAACAAPSILVSPLALGSAPAWAGGHHGLGVARGTRPVSLDVAAGGQRLVVVIMKDAWGAMCLGELGALRLVREDLGGARVVGLTHSQLSMARNATQTVGWPVLADPALDTIGPLGFWIGNPPVILPGIVVYDRCGREVARRLGRRALEPGTGWVIDTLYSIDDAECPEDTRS